MVRPNKTHIAWSAVLAGALMLVFVVLRSNRHVEQPVSAPPGNGLSAVGPPPAPAAKTAGRPPNGTHKAAPTPKPVPPSEPISMKFPSVGLTLPMGTMQAVNGVIDPPSADIGYWISNRGVMPATNAQGSVFTACHTWERGEKPCNKLYNPTDPSKTIKPNAPITVRTQTGTLDYVITNVEAVSKTAVATNQVPDVKCSVPDHLVVVTCVWPDNGQNFVITANLKGKKYVPANC